jgi:hypothetical protein
MAEGILQRLMTETWPARLAKSALEALMLPGQVYQGQVSMTGPDGRTNPEAINKAADLAGLVMGGSYAAAPAMKNASGMGIKAYHGSPHDFDKFDLSKIGTGEGAQAYGHGLYFAENEGVARSYKRPGPHSHIVPTTIDDVPVGQWAGRNDTEKRAVDALARNPTVDEAVKYLQQDRGTEAAQQWLLENAGRVKDASKTGKMYEVNINAHPDQFLDWDKPLSGQSGAVKDAFFHDKNPEWVGGLRGSDAYLKLADKAAPGQRVPIATASSRLNERGIPGIKYLDQGSRNPGFSSLTPSQLDSRIQTLSEDIARGGGNQPRMKEQLAGLERERETYRNMTHNYVVFDDKLIDILKKYGIAGAGPLAALMAQGEEAGVQ